MINSEVVRLNKKFIQKMNEARAAKLMCGEFISFNEISKQLAESEEFEKFVEKVKNKKRNMTDLSINVKFDGMIK